VNNTNANDNNNDDNDSKLLFIHKLFNLNRNSKERTSTHSSHLSQPHPRAANVRRKVLIISDCLRTGGNNFLE